MKKINVANGIFWVEIPEENLYILCGCPADSVKHLMKKGLIVSVEKNGVTYESGPNVILLSDLPSQKGDFCNLAEFPILQMLYRQGMILPGHPNNTGAKPILLGLEHQVNTQAQYIYRGNYGLTSVDEIVQAGESREKAETLMRMKLKFAFDNIRQTEELIDIRTIDRDSIELKIGVTLTRKGLNVYEFTYKGESVSVNLNLHGNDKYEAPYQLGTYHVNPDYFSVGHIGEGDGWDVNRGCMSSILTYQGKLYLIDAGPNIQHMLTALGFSVNEIEGIFHTHCHDDHFAGLTSLLRSDKTIKYFATPLVRASVVKKFATLVAIEENMFSNFFDVIDLECGQWNDIDGLEVKPVVSPHPVETSILFFRTLWEDGYKTYAHFADIVSLSVLKGFVTDDPSRSGISKEFFNQVKEDYLSPVDLKKIDNGGGLIHGVAEDFANEGSHKIILSHSAQPLSALHKEIGANATFGMVDVLIPSKQNYTLRNAFQYLRLYYPGIPGNQLRMLLNCQVETFNTGSILIRKEEKNEDIFLVLSGVLEFLDSKTNTSRTISVGSLLGAYSLLMNEPAKGTYRTTSYVDALKIPGSLFIEFVNKNNLRNSIMKTYKATDFLKKTWLFGEMLSYSTRVKIANEMKTGSYPEGEEVPLSEAPELIMLNQGELRMTTNGNTIELQNPGDFIGEESIVFNEPCPYSLHATKNSIIKRIPGDILKKIPIVLWKLRERLDARKRFIPAAPTDLVATVSGFATELEWKDNSNNETGFKIMRKDESMESFVQIGWVSSDITVYRDETTKEETFWYIVKSTNEAGDSPGSNVVKVRK